MVLLPKSPDLRQSRRLDYLPAHQKGLIANKNKLFDSLPISLLTWEKELPPLKKRIEGNSVAATYLDIGFEYRHHFDLKLF